MSTAPYFCDECRDSGWVRYLVPTKGYYAERCVCVSTNPVIAARRKRLDAKLAAKRPQRGGR